MPEETTLYEFKIWAEGQATDTDGNPLDSEGNPIKQNQSEQSDEAEQENKQ